MSTNHPIEVKKDGLRQCQDGTWKLSLTVHPVDMPVSLMSATMGTRYAMALVEIGDDEKPKQMSEGEKAVQLAGVLCNDEEFRHWFVHQYLGAGPGAGETYTTEHLRSQLGITSRRELATNAEARERFYELVDEFREATGQRAERR